VASATTKMKLGTSILNIVLRNPVITAKSLSSLDVISGGRLFIGVGPGSHKPDYDACGIPFEERWKRFSESIEALTSLMCDSPANYSGNFYKIKDVTIEPKPLQKPHPPIWIGSWGSGAGLRRVAKYGDGWMASAYNINPEQFKERWRRVLSYAREYGRNPDSIGNAVVSMFCYVVRDAEKAKHKLKVLADALGRPFEELRRVLPFGSPVESSKIVQKLAEAGVEHIHFWPVDDEEEQIEMLSEEIIPCIGTR
jgi:alkanesulfonate monooxygenase SsuD/methylene tetrahydromethanopterin reductase-like flavin-dependent oxidoreductase (luciferase family)